VFAPCAAAALYRRDALVKVGGFDESYFAYLEDVDLGFRLRLAGYRCLYVPDAVVRHVGSATTGGQRSDFSVYHGHRNLVWTYFKNMPWPLFWLYLPQHILLNFVSIVYFALRGQGRVILRAKWDALKGLPRILKERRRIQKSRRVSSSELRRVMTKGLLTPYLRR
jgi:GT2 family glycosyltransferase